MESVEIGSVNIVWMGSKLKGTLVLIFLLLFEAASNGLSTLDKTEEVTVEERVG